MENEVKIQYEETKSYQNSKEAALTKNEISYAKTRKNGKTTGKMDDHRRYGEAECKCHREDKRWGDRKTVTGCRMQRG